MEKDPINMLGYGIVAYRDLLYTMIWVFVILSCLAFPSLYYFSSGNGYGDNLRVTGNEVYSLGNLGYAST